MSESNKYYEDYFKVRLPEHAYRMESMAQSSRVRFFKTYLRNLVKPCCKILDIGCGDFFLSRLLPEFNWTGLDINTDCSDKIIKHDVSTVPYPLQDGVYDAVVCSEVLEHVWEPRAIYSEAYRLLKPNGIFIVSTPNHDNIDWVLNHHKEMLFDDKFSHQMEHIRFYNYETHKKYLERYGFVIEDHTGCDAQFVEFFHKPREVLFNYLNEVLKVPHDSGQVDQIIGQMFKTHDAGIMVISRKSSDASKPQ